MAIARQMAHPYLRPEAVKEPVVISKNHSVFLLCIIASILAVIVPRQASAVPQYARRYKLNCYACHTIAPILNEQGYMFKRLGHHLPPSLESPGKAERIEALVKKEPQWTLTNNAALAVSDFNYSAQRTSQQGQGSTSTSAIQVGAWNAYFGGWIPDTNFFYYAEFDIVTGGQTNPNMPNAHIGYVGGTSRSSWYGIVGREHLQVSEGTRAGQIYSLLPNSPLIFENMSPTNFILDQSPVNAEVGYTWASSRYKEIFGVNMKVTNGDNADGSEILGTSNRNGKDLWMDADWWYAPESGVSFMAYDGRKNQIQNPGAVNQFTYYPQIRREGVFANYMVGRDKVDLLGGFLHGSDDWEDPTSQAPGRFTTAGGFGEVDYYLWRGFALASRYDLLRQKVTGGLRATNQEQWQIGTEKAFTPSGNIVGRIAAGNSHGVDPVAFTGSATRTLEADIQFNF